jgi:hypothetical protein
MVKKVFVKSEKKTKKPIKLKKPEKNNKKNQTVKKPTGVVRFRFYKLETEKTEPKPNQKKSSQTGFCPKKPNRTEPNRNRLV